MYIIKNFVFILPESKKVSYLDALSFAKAIIVTSDSVSMVTESCSTGKPTYIIDIPTKSKKFSLFIKNLIDLKLAYYLKDSISLKNRINAHIQDWRTWIKNDICNFPILK